MHTIVPHRIAERIPDKERIQEGRRSLASRYGTTLRKGTHIQHASYLSVLTFSEHGVLSVVTGIGLTFWVIDFIICGLHCDE